ncbi:hypothetical protein ACFSGX_11290 [Sphingomonas arantia]|uniref:Uncharacterized protein n=1 Tax=Sphingomonas arantia TaxID=1460676 RepID=A0ABW4TXC6_9SPHN
MSGYPSLSVLPAEDRATLVEQLLAGNLVSITGAARIVGRNRITVGAYLKQVIAAFSRGGQELLCGCGQPVFHERYCSTYTGESLGISYETRCQVETDLLGGVPRRDIRANYGLSRQQVERIAKAFSVPKQAERAANNDVALRHLERRMVECTDGMRVVICERLTNGEDPAQIATATGLTIGQINYAARGMTGEQIGRRRQIVAAKRIAAVAATARRRKIRERPRAATLPPAYRDRLYATIAATMPRQINPALRDDIISEMYLAVLEERLAAENVKREAKRFLLAGYAVWASKFGPRSLDEMINDDIDRSGLEMIEDPSALEAFDDIRFEREWA